MRWRGIAGIFADSPQATVWGTAVLTANKSPLAAPQLSLKPLIKTGTCLLGVAVTCKFTTPWIKSQSALKTGALSVLHRISSTQLGVSTFSRGNLLTPSGSDLVLCLFPGRSQTTWTSCSECGKHTPCRSKIWEVFFFPALFMHLQSKLLSDSRATTALPPPSQLSATLDMTI